VTTGLPDVVILMDCVAVPQMVTVFVAKPVVGAAHAVGVLVTLTVAQEDSWPLVLMV